MFIFLTAIWITLVLLHCNYDNDGKTINMFIAHILAAEKQIKRNNPVNLVLLRKEFFFFELVKFRAKRCAQ